MAAWTSDALSKIGRAEELEIAPVRRDGTLGTPVTIWVVRLGYDLYVRSYRGSGGSWFRAAQVCHEGQIRGAESRKTSPSWRKPTPASTTRSTPRTAPSTAATQATSRR